MFDHQQRFFCTDNEGYQPIDRPDADGKADCPSGTNRISYSSSVRKDKFDWVTLYNVKIKIREDNIYDTERMDKYHKSLSHDDIS